MTSAPRAMAAQRPSIFACLIQSARNASLAPPALRERSHGVLASRGVAVARLSPVICGWGTREIYREPLGQSNNQRQLAGIRTARHGTVADDLREPGRPSAQVGFRVYPWGSPTSDGAISSRCSAAR